MATPRRETMSATATVENPCCHVSGVENPAASRKNWKTCVESMVAACGERTKKVPALGKGGTGVQLFQFGERKWRKVQGQRGKCAITRGLDAKLPIKGLSLVIGIISDTVFRKIVSERRIVTPENQYFSFSLPFDSIYTWKDLMHKLIKITWDFTKIMIIAVNRS